jgi:hypothetical protein
MDPQQKQHSLRVEQAQAVHLVHQEHLRREQQLTNGFCQA